MQSKPPLLSQVQLPPLVLFGHLPGGLFAGAFPGASFPVLQGSLIFALPRKSQGSPLISQCALRLVCVDENVLETVS